METTQYPWNWTYEQIQKYEYADNINQEITREYHRPLYNISIPGKHKKKKTFHRHIEPFKEIDEPIFNSYADQFQEYMQDCESFPVVLKGTKYDKKTRIKKDFSLQLKNRFQSDRNIKKLSNALNNFRGNGVFLTLTIDPKKIGWYEAWTGLSHRIELFMQNLRRNLKIKLNYVYVVETQLNSTFYPHVHMIFLGIKRLADWRKIQEWWNWGYIYINKTNAGEQVRNPISYIMKYIRKGLMPTLDFESKTFKNNVLIWLFRKRQFQPSNFIFRFLGIFFLVVQDPDNITNIIIVELAPEGGYMAWWRKKHGINYRGYY